MGYQLRTRWLEWHNFTPMPDIESLKRQIETIKLEIGNRERVRESIEKFAPPDAAANLIGMLDSQPPTIADLLEVLDTLERLMPPF
jgi:hypothetical protein